METNELSLIIPVYNGEKYLPATFEELNFSFTNKKIREVIFVNDGSSDKTQELLLDYFQKNNHLNVKVVVNDSNLGKGYSIKRGLDELNENSSIVAFTDVDLPYGTQVFEQNTTHLRDFDLVVGDRTKFSEEEKQYSLYRKFFYKIFRLFVPSKLAEIKDTQCGIKMFRKDVAIKIFDLVNSNGWIFDIELFLIALENNFKIKQIPVLIRKSCVKGKGGVSLIKHGLYILYDLYQVHKLFKQGGYKIKKGIK